MISYLIFLLACAFPLQGSSSPTMVIKDTNGDMDQMWMIVGTGLSEPTPEMILAVAPCQYDHHPRWGWELRCKSKDREQYFEKRCNGLVHRPLDMPKRLVSDTLLPELNLCPQNIPCRTNPSSTLVSYFINGTDIFHYRFRRATSEERMGTYTATTLHGPKKVQSSTPLLEIPISFIHAGSSIQMISGRFGVVRMLLSRRTQILQLEMSKPTQKTVLRRS